MYLLHCIYCEQLKTLKAFNTEHVLIKAFAPGFTNNLTLNNLVCKDCNTNFGIMLDTKLC